MKLSYKTVITYVLLLITANSCHQWDNFTSYFNTYYNMERLRKISEEEFNYQIEKKRIKPRVLVPETEIHIPMKRKSGLPSFLTEFIITKQQRHPVKVKLDSIIIKGSKILANHPKSDYIQGSLYAMALSYFYQNLWLNSQIKCGELIDRFPAGELSPDAHLLLAKNLLIQRKFEAGKILLSRTVDIAWQLERYDILSEAFRIEAELALFQKDFKGAVRPYKQAIIQADDDEYRAKWQFDLAALVFRLGKFDKAEKLFAQVHRFSPDYVTEFEANLYRASSLARLKRYEEAEELLDNLEDDGNNEDWLGNIFAERMNIFRLQQMDEDYEKAEKYSDTSFVGNDAIAAQYFERGMDYFVDHDYSKARLYLGKCRRIGNPVSKKSASLFRLLDQWNRKRAEIIPKFKKLNDNKELTVLEKADLSLNMYEMGRVQEQLGNLDSAYYYYESSTTFSPIEDKESARYIYAFARFLETEEALRADSLFEVIVERYPFTEYGEDSRKRLGYTDSYIINPIDELYESGFSLWKNKDYEFAIIQFSKLFNFYPNSEFAPKSIYTIGWILEKDMDNVNDAIEYYKLLISLYPNSVYAQEIQRSVEYATILQSGEELPDSLKTKEIRVYVPQTDALLAEPIFQEKSDSDASKTKSSESPGIMDIINNPMDIINKAVDSFSSPSELLDESKKKLDKFSSTDSLKNFIPGVNINNPFKDLMGGAKNDSTGNALDSTKANDEITDPEKKDKKKK